MKITLRNLVKNTSLVISEEATDWVLESVDWGTVEARHNMTQYVNLIGAEITSTALQTRDVTIVGWIVASSQAVMTQRKNALNKFIHPQQPIKLVYEGYALVMKPDKTVRYDTDKQKNNEILCRFLIQGTCSKPLFELNNPEVVTESRPMPVPLFPMAIPQDSGVYFGYTPAVDLENLYNAGDMDSGFKVKFTAVAGDVSNPKLLNVGLGTHIEVVYDMLRYDVIEVSTVTGDKYARLTRGGVTTDIFRYVTKASKTDMVIKSGMNSFAVDASVGNNNLSAEISYAPTYLEVQK